MNTKQLVVLLIGGILLTLNSLFPPMTQVGMIQKASRHFLTTRSVRIGPENPPEYKYDNIGNLISTSRTSNRRRVTIDEASLLASSLLIIGSTLTAFSLSGFVHKTTQEEDEDPTCE
ncbi:hypothetical protein P4C99_21780 [Pontiellaceae bacterium B1224]|nr:hypothetical protein [Pontiellaceae bacterium B1224]